MLAEIPAVYGTKGISRCSSCEVPRQGRRLSGPTCNDVAISTSTTKMDQRGITNAVLNFQRRGQGIWSVNHRGIVMCMMNRARLGIGMGAVALEFTGVSQVAAVRARSGPSDPITSKDPTNPPGRSSSMPTADVVGTQVLRGICSPPSPVPPTGRPAWDSAESDARRDQAGLLLDILTLPIARRGPRSRWCRRPTVPAIQVLGDTYTPRIRRQAALPRQPAQPDSRGHPRDPEPGSAGPG